MANPTFEQQDESDVDMLVVVGPEGILMVEGEADFVEESVVVGALQFAKDVTAPVMKPLTSFERRSESPSVPWRKKQRTPSSKKEVMALLETSLQQRSL